MTMSVQVNDHSSLSSKKAFWRRTLGHAGVYLAIAGALTANVNHLSENYPDIHGVRVMILGCAYLTAALVCGFYVAFKLGVKSPSDTGVFRTAVTLRLPNFKEIEWSLEIATYWLGRLLLASFLFLCAIVLPAWAFILVPLFVLYNWLREYLVNLLKKHDSRHLLMLPLDLLFIVFLQPPNF